MSPRVLVVDNYDSFVYNLVQYLGELGAETDVVRNDVETIDQLLARKPGGLVISPTLPGSYQPDGVADFDASLDAAAGEIVLKKYYHIGVATDTPDATSPPPEDSAPPASAAAPEGSMIVPLEAWDRTTGCSPPPTATATGSVWAATTGRSTSSIPRPAPPIRATSTVCSQGGPGWSPFRTAPTWWRRSIR